MLVHVIFLISPPLALTDMFNYINYGRMEVVHHLNPYTTIPVLEPHSDPSYALSNWHQLLSPYGPLFTLLTFAVVPLGVAGSFWALKGILVAASLTIILLVWKCARLLGREPIGAIVLVGLNPIVLVWGLGAGHNDFLMILCIMVGLLPAAAQPGPSTSSGRALPRIAQLPEAVRRWLLPLSAAQVGAGSAFVLAAAIKASGAVLIPVVLAGLLRTPRALVQVLLGMVLAGTVVAFSSLLAFGLHIPDLSTQGSLVTSESVPNLIGLAIGAGGESETLSARARGRAAGGGGGLLLAGLEAAGDDHGRRLGGRGAARDAQLGAPLVRAVGAPDGRAVELDLAAAHVAAARRLPDHRVGARQRPAVAGDPLLPRTHPPRPPPPARGPGAPELTPPAGPGAGAQSARELRMSRMNPPTRSTWAERSKVAEAAPAPSAASRRRSISARCRPSSSRASAST